MKSTKYITLFSTTVVAGLLLSVTACSADENTTPPAESSESVASFDEYTHLAGDLTNEALHTEADTNEEHALITECMADAGFEYFPVEQEELMNTPEDSETPPFGTLEYAQEFGYEISIQNTQQTFPEDMDFDEYLYTYTSENQDYIASLSDAERQAYNDALFGSSDDEGLYEEGCKDLFEKLKKQKLQAFETFEGIGDTQDLVTNFFVTLEDELAEPKDAALSGWRECMSETAFTEYADASPDEMADIVTEKSVDEAVEYMLMLEESEWNDPDDYSAAERAAAEAEVEKFQEFERKLATTDYTCQEEGGYLEQVEQATDELKDAFFTEHREQLLETLESMQTFVDQRD